MSRPPSSSTTARLLRLLSILQARPEWPAPALAVRLGVSERTVRRDVDRLRELDYAIETTRGPHGGYRLGTGTRMPPLMFDEDQAVAVVLALQSAPGLGAGVDEAADRALRTVRQILPTRLARRSARLVVDAAPARQEVDPDVLLAIGEAIATTHELRFDYSSPEQEQPEAPGPPRVVEPHHLVLSAGRWYVLGFSASRDDWRVYRVDRMSLRTPGGRRFERRELPGGDPVGFLSARFKGSQGPGSWPCWGEATVHAPAHALGPFVGDGSLEQVAPDRCRLRLGSWSWDGLAAAFLRIGVDLDDAAPTELREAFDDVGRRARSVSRRDR